MKAIIIEDERGSQEVLKALVHENLPFVEVVDCVETVKKGVKSIIKHTPDIVFLDIELPQENGFALFDYFDNPNFNVIFTTAYDNYAIRAFEYAAIDYLLKPIDVHRLVGAVERVRQQADKRAWPKHIAMFNDYLDRNVSKIPVPTMDGYTFIDVDNILYLEADNNYTLIFTNGDKIMVTKNIGHWEKLLRDFHFMRIHRSHVINLKKVTRYIRAKSPMVVMESGKQLSVSPKKRELLLEQLGLLK